MSRSGLSPGAFAPSFPHVFGAGRVGGDFRGLSRRLPGSGRRPLRNPMPTCATTYLDACSHGIHSAPRSTDPPASVPDQPTKRRVPRAGRLTPNSTPRCGPQIAPARRATDYGQQRSPSCWGLRIVATNLKLDAAATTSLRAPGRERDLPPHDTSLRPTGQLESAQRTTIATACAALYPAPYRRTVPIEQDGTSRPCQYSRRNAADGIAGRPPAF